MPAAHGGTSPGGSGAGAVCTAALSPTNASVPHGESNGSVTLTISDGCAWTVTSNTSWINATSAGSGAGSGTVNYAATTNSSGTGRTGTITIAQQTFTITQDGAPCNATLSPASMGFPASGGTGSVNVSIPAGCAWQASASGFVTIATVSGSGPGAASYSVASNPSASSRSETITIAAESFVVSQAASSTQTPAPAPAPAPTPSPTPTPSPAPTPTPTPNPAPAPTCTVTLSPTGYSGVGMEAGAGGINVSSPVGCAWTATSNVPWITITSTKNMSGGPQGEVGFVVTANTTGASRTGTLTIGGQTFTLQQNGFTCSQSNASLSPTSASFTAAGGTGSITVTYTAGCSWDVLQPDQNWITIASPGTRTGSSTVTYTVAPNSGGSRHHFLGFVGKTFEIYQAGR